jgi:hypothetical protein
LETDVEVGDLEILNEMDDTGGEIGENCEWAWHDVGAKKTEPVRTSEAQKDHVVDVSEAEVVRSAEIPRLQPNRDVLWSCSGVELVVGAVRRFVSRH